MCFKTPNESANDTVWIVTEYDPKNFRISFAWVQAGMVATQLRITFTAAPNEKTATSIRYRYTGLSLAGNALLEGYTREWFETKMRYWESAINHYLRTQKMISISARS